MIKINDQRFILITIQVINVIFGLIVTFYIAANISTELFAIVGAGDIVVLLISTFSFIGVEDYLKQNALHWSLNKTKRLNIFITQALLYRLLIFIVLLPIVIYYLKWYQGVKLNFSQYSNYLYLFIVSSIFRSVIHSAGLILNSLGRFVEIALANSVITVFSKFLGLILFIKFDFGAFLLVYCLTPLIIAPVLLYRIRHYVKFKYLFINKHSLKIVRQSLPLGIASYIRYISNYSYNILASMILTADVFSSYTLINRLIQNIEQLYRNLFLPKLQSFVSKNDDIKFLKKNIRMHFNFINKLVLIYIIIFIITIFFAEKILEYSGLDKYLYLYELILITLSISLLYIYNFNFKTLILLFTKPKSVLFFEIIVFAFFLFTISSTLLLFSHQYLLVYRFFSEILIFIVFYIYFRKRLPFYNK